MTNRPVSVRRKSDLFWIRGRYETLTRLRLPVSAEAALSSRQRIGGSGLVVAVGWTIMAKPKPTARPTGTG